MQLNRFAAFIIPWCLLSVPLVAVIEANRYAYSTPTHKQVPGGDLVARARGFGVPVVELDGNDALACYAATRDARSRGMQGEGPTLIACFKFIYNNVDFFYQHVHNGF